MVKRNTTTKCDIKLAFTDLLQKKGFDSLTVSDIARSAGINRGTFYLHYVDKYDLIEKLEREIIDDLKKVMFLDEKIGQENDKIPLDLFPYESIINGLYYVKDEFSFIAALSSKGGDPNFPNLIKEVLEEMVKIKITAFKQLRFTKKDIPEDYAMEILLSGTVSIIMLWIRKGGIESPEEIAEIIAKEKKISPYEMLF